MAWVAVMSMERQIKSVEASTRQGMVAMWQRTNLVAHLSALALFLL
jgi:hypothetical protein